MRQISRGERDRKRLTARIQDGAGRGVKSKGAGQIRASIGGDGIQLSDAERGAIGDRLGVGPCNHRRSQRDEVGKPGGHELVARVSRGIGGKLSQHSVNGVRPGDLWLAGNIGVRIIVNKESLARKIGGLVKGGDISHRIFIGQRFIAAGGKCRVVEVQKDVGGNKVAAHQLPGHER